MENSTNKKVQQICYNTQNHTQNIPAIHHNTQNTPWFTILYHIIKEKKQTQQFQIHVIEKVMSSIPNLLYFNAMDFV